METRIYRIGRFIESEWWTQNGWTCCVERQNDDEDGSANWVGVIMREPYVSVKEPMRTRQGAKNNIMRCIQMYEEFDAIVNSGNPDTDGLDRT